MELRDIQKFYKEEVLFTKEECDEILKYCTNPKQTNWTVQLDNEFNEVGCSLQSQDLGGFYFEHTKWFFDRVMDWSSKMLDVEYLEEIQGSFRKYKEGDYFIKHKDNVSDGDGNHRFFTISIQLSEEDSYKGGDVIANNTIKFSKKIGNTILWGSDLIHEIKAIKSGERNSIVFFTDKSNLKVKKSLV